MDFGSVKRSEAFAGRRKMFVTRPGKSCLMQDLLGGFDWLSICHRLGIFLMNGFAFKEIMACTQLKA